MSFPKYAEYKTSGVEWLGDVPEHWEITPIKYLVELCGGGTPSKTNLDYWDGAVPWASAKDLKSESLGDTEDHITQHAFTCRLRWEPQTLAVWDNRLCVHQAFNDYQGHRRELYRTTVSGEKPR